MTREVTPIPGESFNGLLHRWAASNFVDRMFDITQAAGVEYPNFQDAAFNERRDLAKIAEKTGIPLWELQSRTLPPGAAPRSRSFFGVSMPKADLELYVRRFAPVSLRLSAHHRALWLIRTLPFCPESWQYLRSTCHRESCGVVQRWSTTTGVERCDRCLADLRDSPSTYVPEPLRDALGDVARLLSPDAAQREETLAGLPAALRGVPTHTTYELLIRLIKVVDPSLPAQRTFTHHADPSQLSRAMAEAWPLLQTWPEGFLDFTAEKIRPRINRSDGNNGETMRFLKTGTGRFPCSDPEVSQLVKEISDSIDVSQSASRGRYLALNEAAGALGHKQSRLSDLRRKGILRTRFAIKQGVPFAAFCSDEIAGLRAGFEDRVSIETVRTELGISCHGVEQLLAMGLLDELPHPYFRARYMWVPVSRTSASAFAAKFDSQARISGGKVSLHHAVRIIGGRMKPWGPILAMLLNRELDYELAEQSEALVRRIYISRSDVSRLRSVYFDTAQTSSFQFERFVTKRDTAETLNLGPVQATDLLRGHYTPRGSRFPAVPIDVVQSLALKYMSAAELAWRLGVSNTRAYLLAKKVGVTQIYPGGFCRSSAVELLDLAY